MRVLVQRVRHASVEVDGAIIGNIEQGLLLFVGIAPNDGVSDLEWMSSKVLNLRVFEDGAGKMNRSVLDVQGGILAVSQFTLYGDARKGNRPSFTDAAQPEIAEPLYNQFVEKLRQSSLNIQTGRFAAQMQVELINDGPITLMLESPNALK
ncbi:MAG: D-tyrosyl-tRNA(Tyr) deacylase [[Candidatus Thermochlorobacteriaceae] bacterium GBChlB]|nr:MAG: D-tyrosyl-tRNA(Tyr) deacylase [[Candidatus Thermochlorobacteriaceae] bacterium GBChlB]